MEWLFSWEVASWFVGGFFATALAFLAMDDYRLAKLFFLLAAADAMGGIAMWGTQANLPRFWVSVLIFLLCGLVGVLCLGAFRYVDGRRKARENAKSQVPSNAHEAVASPPAVLCTMSNAAYPIGTTIAGIIWSRRFIELRLCIVSGSANYEDIDVAIIPDQPVAAIGQATNIPNVVLSSAVDTTPHMEDIDLITGERAALPLVLIASTGGYRVRCQQLSRQQRLELVMAIATIEDFSRIPHDPNPRVAIRQRDYIMKLPAANGSFALWFGYGNDPKGRIEEVYSEHPKSPTKVKIEGRFTCGDQQGTISQEIQVKDVVLDVFNRLKKKLVPHSN